MKRKIKEYSEITAHNIGRNASDILPDSVTGVLVQVIHDMQAALAAGNVVIRPSVWTMKQGKKCAVCLAGSVMLCNVKQVFNDANYIATKETMLDYLNQSEFDLFSEHDRQCFEFINELRLSLKNKSDTRISSDIGAFYGDCCHVWDDGLLESEITKIVELLGNYESGVFGPDGNLTVKQVGVLLATLKKFVVLYAPVERMLFADNPNFLRCLSDYFTDDSKVKFIPVRRRIARK